MVKIKKDLIFSPLRPFSLRLSTSAMIDVKVVQIKPSSIVFNILSICQKILQLVLKLNRKKFGRLVYYFDVTLFLMYLILINMYCITMPKITTNLLDNVRRCPIFLTTEQAQNQTLVDHLIQVSVSHTSGFLVLSTCFLKQHGMLQPFSVKSKYRLP